VRNEFGARGKSRMGATITLAPGQDMKQVDFRLGPHAVITGRITDEEGEPLANVQVQAMMHRYMQGRRQLMPSGSASTNDLGEYRIFGLPPGRYFLSATWRAMGMGMGSVDRSAANQPEEGFAATYYPGTLDPSAAVQLNVSAGRPVTGMDIRLRRTKTVRIRGRVTNLPAHSPMRPMVFLNQRESSSYMFERNMSPVRANDGTFEIRGVTPAAYYVTAQSFDGQDRQFARVSVEAGNTNVDGLELTLAPGQEIAGTIKVEGEGQVNPAAVRVYLEPKEMTPMGGGGMSSTKPDGSFTIRSVVPDTYRVRVMIPQNQGYLKSVFLGQQEAKDGEITISAGVSPALSVVVSTSGAQVSGEVKGDKDTPVQGAVVALVPDTAKRQQQALYKNATTDQYGRFSLAGIAPGNYKVFAWDAVEFGEWMDPDFLQAWESKGVAVTLKEGSKENADLTLLKTDGVKSQ
jgi:protocatechuate 3,4-dioxygenase beta subunit